MRISSEGGFKPSENITADVLVVAGGGGGGWAPHSAGGGGGGGGGFKYFSQKSLTADVALSVTVGAGGAGQKEGGDSSFGSDTSAGGGAGDMTTAGGSYTGGSGGGGRYNTSGHAGTANQGNDGGNGYGSHPSYSGGGGGGASAVGGNGSGNGVLVALVIPLAIPSMIGIKPTELQLHSLLILPMGQVPHLMPEVAAVVVVVPKVLEELEVVRQVEVAAERLILAAAVVVETNQPEKVAVAQVL